MKIDKLSIDGKKQSIEVLDKIFSAKINNQLVSGVIYKLNANFKGRKPLKRFCEVIRPRG